MPDALRVTRATEADLPIILRFVQDLADYERIRDHCVATEEKLRRSLFGEQPHAEVLIARLGDEPAGFAVYFNSYSTFLAQRGLYLEDLFVTPEARGKGIGYALLTELARITVDRGYQRLEWTVLDWNELAIDFYKRIGAIPKNEWTTFRLSGEALEAMAAK